MKEKLLALLKKSREHAISEQKRIEETLAVIDYEIECIKNSVESKSD